MLPGRTYKPEDLIRIAWLHKWIILGPLVVIAAAVSMYARSLPDMYRSQTTILVVPQRVPESYVRATVTSRIEDRLQSLRQQILSRAMLEPIIIDLNLYPEQRAAAPIEAVVEQMRRAITVEIVRGDAFSVSYVSTSPQAAKLVAERLASLFIKENLREREVLADGTNEFLETQLVEARRRLEEHERTLAEYRRTYSGELPSQLESNLQILNSLNLQAQGLANDVERDRDRRLLLERALADLVDAGAAAGFRADRDGGVSPVHERLAAARASLDTLLARLRPEHPDVGAARRLVADLERQAGMAATIPAVAPAMLPGDAQRQRRLADLRLEQANLDREIARKQQEETRVRDQVAIYQARVEATPKRESELIALTRDYDTLEKIYTSLLGKREDSALAASLERRQIGEQFKVLDPARVPQQPFSPNRRQINILGLLMGLALGVACAAVLEYRDSTLKTEEDVRVYLSLPVLAAIPVLADGSVQPRHKAVAIGASRLARWVLRGGPSES